MDGASFVEHDVEVVLRCKLALLKRENAALREDNNVKAWRINNLELAMAKLREKIEVE